MEKLFPNILALNDIDPTMTLLKHVLLALGSTRCETFMISLYLFLHRRFRLALIESIKLTK